MTKKKSLDKDLKKIVRLENALQETARSSTGLALGFLFLVLVLLFSMTQAGAVENSLFVIVAGVIGGYMALNIGANDVANNVGPAVGSKALTMIGALLIAAICEAGGALLAGGDVVSTIKKGIIDPGQIADGAVFIWAMISALLAAALWLNLATYIGAPVSTTHSIVGGVMGAGIAAAGFATVNWPTMGKIAASWVISPALGGIIAAIFYAFVQAVVLKKDDKIAAARRWVPILVAIMTSAFAAYLMMKGLKKLWKFDSVTITAVAVLVFVAVSVAVRPWIVRHSRNLENRRKAISGLFTIPLIGSAALLSFAHGANDVANAVGPLAAIVSAAASGGVETKVGIPIWVMVIGAVGISVGLGLYGPKLIRTVGEKITKLDQIRAFCVALSAAITVIAASALGLPVSSTHIAVGAVFGVGLFREYQANRKALLKAGKRESVAEFAEHALENGFRRPEAWEGVKDLPVEKMLKKAAKAKRRLLVRRSHLLTIVAAWLITVPLAALLAAGLFLVLQALMSA